jgi:DNA-binding GntR family transcriptional regulator
MVAKAASAHAHLKQLAIEGELRPRRRLSPGDLARALRVSMTPVRDALVQLWTEGFIHFDHGRGYWSKPFTVEEQRQLHDLNMLLAAGAIAPAASRPPRETLRSLGAPGPEEADQAQDPWRRGRLAAARVEAVLAAMSHASGNAALARVAQLATEQTHLVRVLDLQDPQVADAWNRGLAEFTAALAAGEAARALALARELGAGRQQRLPELVRRANAHAEAARFP